MHHVTSNFCGLICFFQAMQRIPAYAVGCFKLPHRHAVTLTITAPGELRIAHGRAWLTFANAAQDVSVRAGDHFLEPGEALRLTCGQKVVMEALDAEPEAAVYFSWAPDAVLSVASAASPRRLLHAEVRQPLLDLVAALHQAGWALGRLVQGVSKAWLAQPCSGTAHHKASTSVGRFYTPDHEV